MVATSAFKFTMFDHIKELAIYCHEQRHLDSSNAKCRKGWIISFTLKLAEQIRWHEFLNLLFKKFAAAPPSGGNLLGCMIRNVKFYIVYIFQRSNFIESFATYLF